MERLGAASWQVSAWAGAYNTVERSIACSTAIRAGWLSRPHPSATTQRRVRPGEPSPRDYLARVPREASGSAPSHCAGAAQCGPRTGSRPASRSRLASDRPSRRPASTPPSCEPSPAALIDPPHWPERTRTRPWRATADRADVKPHTGASTSGMSLASWKKWTRPAPSAGSQQPGADAVSGERREHVSRTRGVAACAESLTGARVAGCATSGDVARKMVRQRDGVVAGVPSVERARARRRDTEAGRALPSRRAAAVPGGAVALRLDVIGQLQQRKS